MFFKTFWCFSKPFWCFPSPLKAYAGPLLKYYNRFQSFGWKKVLISLSGNSFANMLERNINLGLQWKITNYKNVCNSLGKGMNDERKSTVDFILGCVLLSQYASWGLCNCSVKLLTLVECSYEKYECEISLFSTDLNVNTSCCKLWHIPKWTVDLKTKHPKMEKGLLLLSPIMPSSNVMAWPILLIWHRLLAVAGYCLNVY